MALIYAAKNGRGFPCVISVEGAFQSKGQGSGSHLHDKKKTNNIQIQEKCAIRCLFLSRLTADLM